MIFPGYNFYARTEVQNHGTEYVSKGNIVDTFNLRNITTTFQGIEMTSIMVYYVIGRWLIKYYDNYFISTNDLY